MLGSILVTSFLTPSPNIDPNSEWDMSQINSEDLLLSKIIMFYILDIKFTVFRSSLTTKLQLENVGFNEIEFVFDNAKIYPTVVACQPKQAMEKLLINLTDDRSSAVNKSALSPQLLASLQLRKCSIQLIAFSLHSVG